MTDIIITEELTLKEIEDYKKKLDEQEGIDHTVEISKGYVKFKGGI